MKHTEFSLIASLRVIVQNTLKPGELGIGDDAAILPLSSQGPLVFCTDTLVENVHFSYEHLQLEQIGWKALAVTLSDIAAMGAKPLAALISVTLPERAIPTLEAVYRGIQKCALAYDVSILGGDTVASKEFSLSVAALGSLGGEALRRDAAKEGQSLWVSGQLGAASLGLVSFQEKERLIQYQDQIPEFRLALQEPRPQIALGRALAEGVLASAAIDTSDGLIQDASHIASASQVDIHIKEDALPVLGQGSLFLEAALCGGEDYQLLFTSNEPPTAFSALQESHVLSCIGEVHKGNGSVLIDSHAQGLLPAADFLKQRGFGAAGYDHFLR